MTARPIHRIRGARAWAAGLVLALLALPALAGSRTLNVRVEGRVAHPGAQTLPAGARLADAVLPADMLPDAYPLGAAWLRNALRAQQTRDKAGLLYEAGVLHGQARLDGNAELAQLAARLQTAWRAMPVTGRQVQALLDPRPLEISDRNRLLADGDRVVYPARPSTVRVVGAVARPCTLSFTPLASGRDYLSQCPRAAAADPDWVVLIQPDGRLQRRGIAAWNRQPAQPLTPGAMVYVPLKPAALPESIREDFNTDAVHFLATQVLATDVDAGGAP